MKGEALVVTALLWCCFILLVAGNESSGIYSVTFTAPNTWALVTGKVDGYAALAQIEYTMNQTGWATLDISTSAKQEDTVQAFAAGYIEGALTTDGIHSIWMTQVEYLYNGSMNAETLQWLIDNDMWVRDQVTNCSSHSTPECSYWYQVGLVLAQLDGLVMGYNTHCDLDKKLPYEVFLYLNAQDDLDDIEAALSTSMNEGSWEDNVRKRMESQHCSSLVKYSETEKQIYQAHVTWDVYANMLRIFKHYSFPYSHPSTAAVMVSFSGSPGFLASGDDYFITDRGMMVTETTNGVYNNSLYDHVSSSSVLYWIRVLVATRMADNGSQWVDLFAKYNSGTYNNQWQVTDTKLFTSGQPIQPGTFYLLEQIPGFVQSADLSSVLSSNGYFASYNIPYFPFIYNISGFAEQYEQNGDGFSYDMCPRAQIFRRDQSKVETLDDMQNIMRSNGYLTDPLCINEPCECISSRCDLNLTDPWPYGAIDCKVSSTVMVQSMQTSAVSGPTTLHLPPFSWQDFDWVPHYGEPTLFNFSFQQMQPTKL